MLAEILSWPLKAGSLIRGQYTPGGAAAVGRSRPLNDLLARTRQRQKMTQSYTQAYRQYVRRVSMLADVRVAPFHLLASEGAVHVDRDHAWLLEHLIQIPDDQLYIATSLTP